MCTCVARAPGANDSFGWRGDAKTKNTMTGLSRRCLAFKTTKQGARTGGLSISASPTNSHAAVHPSKRRLPAGLGVLQRGDVHVQQVGAGAAGLQLPHGPELCAHGRSVGRPARLPGVEATRVDGRAVGRPRRCADARPGKGGGDSAPGRPCPLPPPWPGTLSPQPGGCATTAATSSPWPPCLRPACASATARSRACPCRSCSCWGRAPRWPRTPCPSRSAWPRWPGRAWPAWPPACAGWAWPSAAGRRPRSPAWPWPAMRPASGWRCAGASCCSCSSARWWRRAGAGGRGRGRRRRRRRRRRQKSHLPACRSRPGVA